MNGIIGGRVQNTEPGNTGSITESELSESEAEGESAFDVLKEIRIKNVNKIVIGTLNINSLALKFDQLREIIGH